MSFSQALVEFTSNGNLFSSMSCSSDSDSSFTQKPSEAASMVADIADVERDGEGKCEENPEFHNDEDLAASLEAFSLTTTRNIPSTTTAARFYQGLPWV